MTKGFTLLFSVLIIAIVLAVSAGISRVVSSEIFLSNVGRQSQMAFYAANAGVECAIYWDTVHDENGYDEDDPSPFATSTGSGDNDVDDACNSRDIDIGGWSSCVAGLTGNEASSPCTSSDNKRAGKNRFAVDFSNGSCVEVTVIKRENYTDPSFPVIETFIHADGYNTGTVSGSSCTTSSSRVLQRSLEVTVYE